MAGHDHTPTPASCKTIVLVPNTHCPSCITFISGLLAQLDPAPISVVTSIVTHTVTVHHSSALQASKILGTLHEAGYDIELQDASPATDWTDSILGDEGGLLSGVLGRWRRPYLPLDEETRRKRHRLHCKSCRAEDDTNYHGFGRHESGKAKSPINAIDSVSAGSDSKYLASLSVTGMTCGACISNIVVALEQLSWVTSADISLLGHTASIEYRGREDDAAHLVRIVDDLGYSTTVEKLTELPMIAETASQGAREIWEASYSIEGMTCSSCVRAITEAVQGLENVREVEVNLVNHSARIRVEGKDTLDLVAETIEDAGYGASFGDATQAATHVSTSFERRTVSIKVDGMYCRHCEDTVASALNTLNGRVTLEQPATLDRPIATISYVPEAPNFTIRNIINAISDAHSAFNASVYHAPTLEERANLMHARLQRRILYRLLLCVIVAIPTFIIGVVYMALISRYDPGRRYLMQPFHGASRAEWALLVLATPIYFFAADHFHRHMLKELYFLWKPGSQVSFLRRFYRFGSMDMLISLGTTVAYFSSIVQLGIAAGTQANHGAMMATTANTTYFDSVVFLTMFLLAGRLIEAYSKAKAGDAVLALRDLRPNKALLVLSDENKEIGSGTQELDVDMIDLQDIVRVVHGSSPPWDGMVLSVEAVFDEASLTGESRPVRKTTGETVYQGTINKGGPILVRVTRVSGDSMLDQIIKVVREGQARRAPIEKVADILTSYFVPVVTLIAITTWVVWLVLGLSGTLPQSYLDVQVGGWPFWSLQFAIAVYIIACPCGIGLAAPTALFVGGGLAAKHGILAKGGGDAFQEASRLDVIVFDKTGTLTEGGDPKLTDRRFLLDKHTAIKEPQVLAALVAVEENSSHPIGKAIISSCRALISTKVTSEHIEEVPGKGLKGTFAFETSISTSKMEMLVGNESLMTDNGIVLDSDALALLNRWSSEAKSVVVVATRLESASDESHWELAMMLSISDALRPESRFVVESVHKRGLDVWMLSGDNPTTARAVGKMVGIPSERIIAGVLPHEKADKIRYLQRSQVSKRSRSLFGMTGSVSSRRAIVAMIGDGVNDSPALAASDVGIAVGSGSGSEVAISSADFVLVNHDMKTLLTLVTLSCVVFRRVKFNFAWALMYNLIALPIAAGVLYPVRSNGSHIRLGPVWASLAMALSSISVVCSSLLMRTRFPIVGFRGERLDARNVVN